MKKGLFILKLPDDKWELDDEQTDSEDDQLDETQVTFFCSENFLVPFNKMYQAEILT